MAIERQPPASCRVQGCLIAAVAIFVILLIGVLIVAFLRFREPPQPRLAPPTGAAVEAPPVSIAVYPVSRATLNYEL